MKQHYAHKRMASIRSQDSKIELILRGALRANGYRYKLCDRKVFGKPDIVFRKERVAIFCDSLFWHGHDWTNVKSKFKRNKKFWHEKIDNNIKRDYEVNRILERQGWRVIRFWENEIIDDVKTCVRMINKEIKERRKRLLR